MKINLVMIVKNEARSLKRCLRAAKSLVDDMIVVDTGSTDRTRDIAVQMGAKVYDFTWIGDFSAARNFALSCSDADWNLVLDGDEILRSCSRQALERQVRQRGGEWLGGLIQYNSYRDGEEIHVSTAMIPRLLPKGVQYTGIIHEQPDSDFPCFQTPLAVDHDGYLYTDKGERNLPYLEKAVEEHPKDAYYQYQLAFTLRNLKRLPESLPHFRRFYELGEVRAAYWRQGVVLYLYTLMDLGEQELLLEALEIINKEKERLDSFSDFSFVCGLFYMKLVLSDVQKYLEYLPKIEESYLHCLEIGEQPQQGGVVGTGSFLASYNLGVWYEVSGQKELALRYYNMAVKEGYEAAGFRVRGLKK